MLPENLRKFVESADAIDADVALYNGLIGRPYDEDFIDLIHDNKQKENLLLILVTSGGDSHSAYKIARYLQESYDHITVFISGFCKSAGTLIAIGAHELVFSRHGELGPLDVQMAKQDEIWVSQSGLIINTALDAVQDKAFIAFEKFFLEMKSSSRTITTRTASDISTKLVTGLFSKLYESIDPFHIGEAARAIAIATRYGTNLSEKSKNIKEEDNLLKLITDYPDHGFVIDREEAKELFSNVRNPNEHEQNFVDIFGSLSRKSLYREPLQIHVEMYRSEYTELTKQGD